MLAIHKILAPTDFSACSEPALRYAGELGRTLGATVVLLHVAETAFDYTVYGLAPETIADLQTEARQAIDKRLAEAKGFVGVDGTTTRIREGSPAQEIVEAAKQLEVDLIVMGTHGRTGVRHMLAGSTAEKVVRTAACPVLTVRASEPC